MSLQISITFALKAVDTLAPQQILSGAAWKRGRALSQLVKLIYVAFSGSLGIDWLSHFQPSPNMFSTSRKTLCKVTGSVRARQVRPCGSISPSAWRKPALCWNAMIASIVCTPHHPSTERCLLLPAMWRLTRPWITITSALSLIPPRPTEWLTVSKFRQALIRLTFAKLQHL